MRNVNKLLGLGILLFLVSSLLQAEVKERYIFDPEKQKWVKAESLTGPIEGVLGEVQELITDGKIRKAEKKLKRYLKEGPKTEKDRRVALLLYGDCAFIRGKFRKAHKRYKQLIDEYPNTREYALALRKELEIGRAWLSGRKQIVLGFIPVPAIDEAIDILDMIEQLGKGHRIAEVAIKLKADYYYKSGQFEFALEEYRKLSKISKGKEYKKYALYQAAVSALADFPGVDFDDTPLLDAMELYNEYLNSFPETDREEIEEIITQIQNKLAYKEFKVGKFYKRIGKPISAKYYFEYVINHWPDTLWADRAKAELEKMGFDVEGDESEVE